MLTSDPGQHTVSPPNPPVVVWSPMPQTISHAARLPRTSSGESALRVDPAWLAGLVGKQVGRAHRIVRHAASGGMGHVFIVEHVELGAFAAVKVAHPDSEVARETLAHEAKL